MNITNSVSAEGFTLQLAKRVLEPEEVISGEEAQKYANRRDNRTLIAKLTATDIVEKLSLDSTSNILEVACGAGQLAYEIWKLIGCKMSATDGSPELIKAATERYAEASIRFRAENLHGHGGIGEFDAVICKDSFHHFIDSKQAIAEIMSLLKPKGKIYVFDLCRNARIDEIERRLVSIQDEHERMRFLRSLNASLMTDEFKQACGTSGVSVFYPLSFSDANIAKHRDDIESDVVKEHQFSSLFSVYVIEKE